MSAPALCDRLKCLWFASWSSFISFRVAFITVCNQFSFIKAITLAWLRASLSEIMEMGMRWIISGVHFMLWNLSDLVHNWPSCLLPSLSSRDWLITPCLHPTTDCPRMVGSFHFWQFLPFPRQFLTHKFNSQLVHRQPVAVRWWSTWTCCIIFSITADNKWPSWLETIYIMQPNSTIHLDSAHITLRSWHLDWNVHHSESVGVK